MSKQVNTLFSEVQVARLEAYADRVGLTISALVRLAATEYLDAHERSTGMRDMLVGWTVNGMNVMVGSVRPGQEPGNNLAGTVVRVTGIPDDVTSSEVVKAVEATCMWLPHGPFDIPWEMLGEGKVVTATRLSKTHEAQ